MHISRLAPPAAAIAAAAVLAVVPLSAAKSKRTIKFTNTAQGASLSATKAAFADHDSVFGNGAGVQVVKLNSDGSSGSDTTTVYYGSGTATSKDTFTIGQPDAKGVAPLTGKGNDVKGTGRFKGLRSSYTFTG